VPLIIFFNVKLIGVISDSILNTNGVIHLFGLRNDFSLTRGGELKSTRGIKARSTLALAAVGELCHTCSSGARGTAAVGAGALELSVNELIDTTFSC
jgi:hypothetical protein